MSKKWIYLFLALALPGLIFIFLKKFGRNEFDVPVYFEKGIIEDSVCGISTSSIYHVPDSIINKYFTGQSHARVAVVHPFVKDDLKEVERIAEKYSNDELEIILLSGVPNNPNTNLNRKFLDYNQFGITVHCLLRIQEPWSVVLLDGKNQIRGFYDGSRRDEMDRLDLELSILLKKY